MQAIPAALLWLGVVASAGLAGPAAEPEVRSLDGLAAATESYFPKAQGEVTSVSGDVLTLGIGRKHGLLPGMTLSIWREGKELLHPVTGRPLGRAEDEVGTAEVTAVQESEATATVGKKIGDPRVGDRARMSPKQIHLAVTGSGGVRRELIAALRERLSEQERFTVLDGAKTDEFFSGRTGSAAASAREAGRQLGVDAVIVVRATMDKDRTAVAAEVVNAGTGASLGTVTAVLEQTAKRDVLGEIKPYFSSVLQRRDDIPPLPVRATLFAANDLDGDGRPEYVLSDGPRLYIYRFVPSGWKEVWTEADSRAADGDDVIAIGIADINGNGTPEVFATLYRNRAVTSLVLEAHDGAFRVIARLPVFLRVLASPGKGPLLIGQEFDPARFYGGVPKHYAWSGEVYAPSGAFPLPRPLDLYGFVMLGSSGGAPLFVTLDETDHLCVYSGEALIWTGKKRYAASARMIRAADDRGKMSRSIRISTPLALLDIDGDGRYDVIVPRNIKTGLFGGSKEAELHGLAWGGEGLEDRWMVAGLPGAVLDLQAEVHGAGPARAAALVREKGGWFSRSRSTVKRYSFE